LLPTSPKDPFVQSVDNQINAVHDQINADLNNRVVSDKVVGATPRRKIGTRVTKMTSKGVEQTWEKVSTNKWKRISSEALDTDGEKGYTSTMTTKKEDISLIPNADVYLDQGFNVLLIGLHGTGKTASIQALARDRGFKMKYYSCSTLDPFTDLVGVPTPRDYCPECKLYFKDESKCPECQGRTVEALKMVRPREVDEAEIIFLDEFNRADGKTQNALFEMIQFGTINGEPLPNLKACWAAINPPDDEQNYQVDAIDPAMMDRFDVYIDITPKPSVTYMTKHMPEPIALSLKLWWDDHQNAIRLGSKDAHSDYISPRRLEKIGLVWCATKSPKSVFAALPRGGQFEKNKLVDHLKAAQKQVNQEQGIVDPSLDDGPDLGGNGLGDRPSPLFTYRKANIRMDAEKLADHLAANPNEFETHKKVADELKSGAGGQDLVLHYGAVINALNPSTLEGMVAGFPPPKVKLMREGFMTMYQDTPDEAKKLTHLHKVLTATPGAPTGWPAKL
jgi:hypothetical protein